MLIRVPLYAPDRSSPSSRSPRLAVAGGIAALINSMGAGSFSGSWLNEACLNGTSLAGPGASYLFNRAGPLPYQLLLTVSFPQPTHADKRQTRCPPAHASQGGASH